MTIKEIHAKVTGKKHTKGAYDVYRERLTSLRLSEAAAATPTPVHHKARIAPAIVVNENSLIGAGDELESRLGQVEKGLIHEGVVRAKQVVSFSGMQQILSPGDGTSGNDGGYAAQWTRIINQKSAACAEKDEEIGRLNIEVARLRSELNVLKRQTFIEGPLIPEYE